MLTARRHYCRDQHLSALALRTFLICIGYLRHLEHFKQSQLSHHYNNFLPLSFSVTLTIKSIQTESSITTIIMKSSIAILSSLVATSTAQVFCIQAITATMPYLPALTLAANNSCPTARNASYYSVEGAAGCCSSAATAVSIQSTTGLACCPCGAQCTGKQHNVLYLLLWDTHTQQDTCQLCKLGL